MNEILEARESLKISNGGVDPEIRDYSRTEPVLNPPDGGRGGAAVDWTDQPTRTPGHHRHIGDGALECPRVARQHLQHLLRGGTSG